MNKRLEALLKEMNSLGIDAALLTSDCNKRYISGFTGSSAYAYISNKRRVLMTDFRYMEQAKAECPEYEIIDYMGIGLTENLEKLMAFEGAKTLGTEEHQLTVREHQYFKDCLEGITFESIEDVVEALRMIKDDEEIDIIEKAAAIGDQAFSHIIEYMSVGMSELEVAIELEYHMRKQGASGLSFDTIVASGKRSSLPHGIATEKIIETGDFVTMDFGCVYKGYCSDMTRTVVMGKASEKQKIIYDTVLAAQMAGLEAVKADITGCELDLVARDIIYAAGYEGYFGHGLGHSVGLEVHENPRISSRGIMALKENMIITIEPGIYIPEFGGVRIEDLVVVKEAGHVNLVHSTKKLLEL